MKTTRSIFTAALAVLLLLPVACDDADFDEDTFRESRYEVREPSTTPTWFPPGWVGSMWAPCDLEGVDDDPDWWGCNGSLGEGLACARPLGDELLSICVPQIKPDGLCLAVWDPGFGDGLVEISETYCVISCDADSDCRPLQECSAFGKCAWTPAIFGP